MMTINAHRDTLPPMPQIQISEFKATRFAVLDRVARTGESVVVTRRGIPIARIVPPAPNPAASWLGSMKGSVTIRGDIVAPATDPSLWEVLR